MSLAKTATVTAFLSLSGILFLNAILNLARETGNGDQGQESPNQKASQPDQAAIAPSSPNRRKAAIAQPEKLSNVPLLPAYQRQRTALTQVNPLLVAPGSQAFNDGSGGTATSAIAQQQAAMTQLTRGIAPPESLSNHSSTAAKRGHSRSDIPTPFTDSLKDIEGHWAQYYIEFLLSRNVIQGFPDGNFRPDRTVTTSEFTKMAQKAFREPATVPVSYQDLQVLTPARPATRAEAAALIYRTLMRTEAVPIVTSVQINGAVARPGGYSLAAASDARLGQGKNLPTVSRAIQQAGGLLSTGNLRSVEIHRTTELGAKKVIKVDVQRLLQSGDLAQDVVLQQDDKLVIPAMAPAAQQLPQIPKQQGMLAEPANRQAPPKHPEISQQQTTPQPPERLAVPEASPTLTD